MNLGERIKKLEQHFSKEGVEDVEIIFVDDDETNVDETTKDKHSKDDEVAIYDKNIVT